MNLNSADSQFSDWLYNGILTAHEFSANLGISEWKLSSLDTLLALLDIRVQLISEASRIFDTAYVRRPVRRLAILTE